MSVDSVFRTRSLGVAAEGLPDQYADGKAAKVWELYIGDTQSRTQEYKSWVVSLLREQGVRRVLDVACGTGVDSIMLVEEGFNMVSVDASDKMLKYALKSRWERRKEPAFDQWVIEEANWLTLPEDIQKPGDGFDAVICLGNSFAHLPDFKGDQSDQKLALQNIASMVRPGGILIIDHRNYDYILETGRAPQGKNIYYKSVKCQESNGTVLPKGKFRLSYYPHRLESFKGLLNEAFNGNMEHNVFGDFKTYIPGQSQPPCYFIHAMMLACSYLGECVTFLTGGGCVFGLTRYGGSRSSGTAESTQRYLPTSVLVPAASSFSDPGGSV
ncbi:glycine N-methyltransferase isoform X1 [Lates japonicus]|uniref:Glycine N-methyltransferase n=1 Tax=Lates japonicus TaxID=270547 RepID=A0AAD3MLA8_LATJO|nr:glycine N-methyltransferase isoform X1 [Lates japonicus]